MVSSCFSFCPAPMALPLGNSRSPWASYPFSVHMPWEPTCSWRGLANWRHWFIQRLVSQARLVSQPWVICWNNWERVLSLHRVPKSQNGSIEFAGSCFYLYLEGPPPKMKSTQERGVREKYIFLKLCKHLNSAMSKFCPWGSLLSIPMNSFFVFGHVAFDFCHLHPKIISSFCNHCYSWLRT